MIKEHICIQTGKTCGIPCYDGCTQYNGIFDRRPKEIKKTFVEWCKDPFVVQQKDFHPNMHKIREINELIDYWDR